MFASTDAFVDHFLASFGQLLFLYFSSPSREHHHRSLHLFHPPPPLLLLLHCLEWYGLFSVRQMPFVLVGLTFPARAAVTVNPFHCPTLPPLMSPNCHTHSPVCKTKYILVYYSYPDAIKSKKIFLTFCRRCIDSLSPFALSFRPFHSSRELHRADDGSS